MTKFLGFFILFLQLAGNVLAQNSSTIGVRVFMQAPFGSHIVTAEAVYFIRLYPDTSNLLVDSVFKSDYVIDDHVYIRNIEPGYYAIVAAQLFKQAYDPDFYDSTSLTTFFSIKLIKESIIYVQKNELVYGGSYFLKNRMMTSKRRADDAQLHFFKTITEFKSPLGYFPQIWESAWFYRTNDKKSELVISDKSEFLRKAIDHSEEVDNLEPNKAERNEY